MRTPLNIQLAIIALILLATSCQSQPEKVSTTPEAATFTPIVPTPSSSPSATPTEAATPIPADTATPLITPDIQTALPVNWRAFGNPRLGIEIPAPRSWYDATSLLRGSEIGDRYEPLVLWLTDQEETAKRLMAGVALNKGAYIFGYVGKSIPPVKDPARALSQVIAELGLEDSVIGDPVRFVSATTPSAFIDLVQDPLDLFPLFEQELRYRLILLTPQDGTPAIVVLASTHENWNAHLSTFSTVMDRIRLSQSRDRVMRHLNSGDAVSGNLIGNISDIWTFNGDEGLFASIHLTPKDARMDMTLALINPEGEVISVVDDGYEGDSEALTDIPLSMSGTYLIEAREFFNETGRYELELDLSNEARFSGGGTIGIGQEVSALLAENGEHTWSFQGTAGQTVTVILSSLDDQLDVILEIVGPTGVQMGTWDESFAGDAEVATGVALSITGEYTIVVHGFAGRGGLYGLSLDEGGESTQNLYDAGDLAHGDSKREYLREDEVHAWFFDGQELDEISIEVLPLGENMDLEISLIEPTISEYLVSVDDHLSGERETLQFLLPEAGQYAVIVREFFGGPGEYEILLDVHSGPELDYAGTITYGEAITGTLSNSRPSSWTFEGAAGDTVIVILTPQEEDRDLLFELVDPAGNTVAEVDSSLNDLPEQLLNFVLQDDGQWTIVIREFFGEPAAYELGLSLVEE